MLSLFRGAKFLCHKNSVQWIKAAYEQKPYVAVVVVVVERTPAPAWHRGLSSAYQLLTLSSFCDIS